MRDFRVSREIARELSAATRRPIDAGDFDVIITYRPRRSNRDADGRGKETNSGLSRERFVSGRSSDATEISGFLFSIITRE